MCKSWRSNWARFTAGRAPKSVLCCINTHLSLCIAIFNSIDAGHQRTSSRRDAPCRLLPNLNPRAVNRLHHCVSLWYIIPASRRETWPFRCSVLSISCPQSSAACGVSRLCHQFSALGLTFICLGDGMLACSCRVCHSPMQHWFHTGRHGRKTEVWNFISVRVGPGTGVWFSTP